MPATFRLQGKAFFLTFPQCDVEPAEALRRLKDLETADLEWVVVSREAHADGGNHLHAVLMYKQRKSVCSPSYFDVLGGKHGNYATCRHVYNSVKYAVKDGNYVSDGIDVPTYLEAASRKRSSKVALVAKRVLDGATLDDLVGESPDFVLMHKRRLVEFIDLVKERREREAQSQRKPFRLHVDTGLEQITIEIGNGSVQHYWFWGGTGLGKTTRILNPLNSNGRGFELPYNNDYAGFDNYHDFLWLDEFKGQLTGYALNRLCDSNGQVPFKLNFKGGTTVKNRQVPIIICSNFPPDQVYKEPALLGPIERRFRVVEIKQQIHSHVETDQ